VKTTQCEVRGTAYIWAVPKSEWKLQREVEENDGSMLGICPFQYEITDSDTNWRPTAVRVADFGIVGTVPPGIDLVLKAVETLRNKIVTIQAEADKEIAQVEEQIRNLALLEYKPSEDVVSEQ